MTITNGSFDQVGATPGAALGWTSSFVATAEAFADFDQNPSATGPLARETFDAGWAGVVDQEFVQLLGEETLGTEAAVFNAGPGQAGVERFEVGWGDPPMFAVQMSGIDLAVFGSADHEPFTTGWATWDQPAPGASANAFLPTLPTPTSAMFDSSTVAEERFNGWATPMLASFAPGDLVTLAAETFEDAVAPATFTVSASSDIGTLTGPPARPLVDDEPITLTTTGTLPPPLEVGLSYHMDLQSPNSFKFASVSGGDGLNLTGVGNGVHSVVRDPAAWWWRFMATV